ncbi:class I SAM-dependent methyltransferase [Stappia sp. ICDLI1TA098]|jgi:hypothetical protein
MAEMITDSLPRTPVLDRVHAYYCTRLDAPAARRRTIYEIWEAGEAHDDSVTPSTYCPDYRAHIGLKIVSLTQPGARIFSIGCGNAFVEADLVGGGRHVQAIDCNPEAVALATRKGLEAFVSDFFTLPDGHLSGFDAIYADGLLGHLYRSDTGLADFFGTLRRLAPKPGAWLIFSNDAPLETGHDVEPHRRVADFWMLSRARLVAELETAGYTAAEDYHYPYLRPVSGLRNRTICIGCVPTGFHAGGHAHPSGAAG